MSKFDFGAFTGDYPFAVSKERYTEQEAIEIAKHEMGYDKLKKIDMYVRFGYGCDEDGEKRNCWWLELYPTKRSCPVWAFTEI